MFACVHGQPADLLQIAAAFSPWFEQTAPDTIVFSIDPLKRLYGTPRQIGEAIAQRAGDSHNIAIAETADAAILAARNFSGLTVAPQMSDLDVASLPIPDDLQETLETWGIHTIEQLAQLPEIGIAERFGSAGVYLQRLAKNAIHRPLRIAQPEIAYEDRIELDHPVSLLEPLLFLISRILNDQCAKLLSNAMAANEIAIRLQLEDRTEHVRKLSLPVPMRESKSLLKLLQMDLEAHPPQAATIALALCLKPVPPRTIQDGIFLPAAPAPDKLELTLARIRGLVGENNVGLPELLNTHHPHPFRLIDRQPQISSRLSIASRQAFRYFRPPISATVDLDHNRPIRIAGSGIQGKVLHAAGPWRTSGDWWTTTHWNRDEWDIALANGALYRVYSERTARDAHTGSKDSSRHSALFAITTKGPDCRWFIEGSYD